MAVQSQAQGSNCDYSLGAIPGEEQAAERIKGASLRFCLELIFKVAWLVGGVSIKTSRR